MWIANAPSIVCSEMLKLSRNNQNIKIPNTLPLVIGIFCYWVLFTLQHVIQNNCQWVYWFFLMVWSTFWRSRKFLTNLPKLSCGFKLKFENIPYLCYMCTCSKWQFLPSTSDMNMFYLGRPNRKENLWNPHKALPPPPPKKKGGGGRHPSRSTRNNF